MIPTDHTKRRRLGQRIARKRLAEATPRSVYHSRGAGFLSCEFVNDTTVAVTDNDGLLHLYNVATGTSRTKRATSHEEGFCSLHPMEDEHSLLVSLDDCSTSLLDVVSDKVRRNYKWFDVYDTLGDQVLGKYVVDTLVIWKGDQENRLPIPQCMSACFMSEHEIATLSTYVFKVWDVRRPTEPVQIVKPKNWPANIIGNCHRWKDDSILFTSGRSCRHLMMSELDLATGGLHEFAPCGHGPLGVVSFDRRHETALFATEKGKYCLWDGSTRRDLNCDVKDRDGLDSSIRDVALSSDGTQVVGCTEDGDLFHWTTRPY